MGRGWEQDRLPGVSGPAERPSWLVPDAEEQSGSLGISILPVRASPELEVRDAERGLGVWGEVNILGSRGGEGGSQQLRPSQLPWVRL